jgi:alanyl-tRNA synthetase
VPDDPKPKFMTGNDIREMFLRFFESKGHRRVRSSSLVPHGDPTLLFTNAGMNQFKDVFLGLEKRDYNRATTAQKCVRAGGKHNDLENVGFTKRHHTFFEMMGNFSFGPLGTIGEQPTYFKEKAIPYAWELITSPEWYGIPKEKLYATVFGGAEVSSGTTLGVDEEARGFWLQHVPAERIFPIPGLKDNFWAMGDTGPCGPCSELHYDMGPAASEAGHADCQFPCDCGRYVEIWNLVFMQFNREPSAVKLTEPLTVTETELHPLPKPSIDTGMGLERVACVLQGVISNYDTDLFLPIITAAGRLTNVRYGADFKGDASLRVIADHARAATFLISDGVVPSNDGRGYVLRKIIRRAVRHGRLLDQASPFLFKLVATVVSEMGGAYPEIVESQERVAKIVFSEEERFARTLSRGWKEMEEMFGWIILPRSKEVQELEANLPPERLSNIPLLPHQHQMSGIRRQTAILRSAGRPVVFPGDQAFKLYDTYGLPKDFIYESARDMGFDFDEEGFEKSLEEQRSRAKASWKGASKELASPAYAKIAETFKTEKDFYHGTSAKDCRIEAIFRTAGVSPASVPTETPTGSRRYEMANELEAGETGEVVLDRTPIYADSGGQMADTGWFYDPTGTGTLAEVTGAYYPVAGLVAHKVVAKETLHVGDRICVQADADRHARIIRNHSGTHLVHAALRNILGTHVKQAGSLNSPDRLRFDFSHFAHVDPEELRDIEQQVNDEIRHNTQIETDITSIDEALASGALAFFGDKYPESNVRVVTIPDERAPRGFYSKELCGGTHVHRIGDIGVLKIVSEGSVAAGVRRIEAVTGMGALEHYEKQARLLAHLTSRLNTGEDELLASVEKMANTLKTLEKELEAQKRKGALGQLDQLAAQVQTIKGVKLVAAEVAAMDKESLRQLVDSLRQKLGSGVVALGMAEDGKVSLIAGVTKDLTAKVHAGKMIQTLAKLVGGSGGGRPDLAEAGGKDTSALKSTLGTIPGYLEGLL